MPCLLFVIDFIFTCVFIGLAAPAPTAFSAPYVINAQEPYVGTLIAGELVSFISVMMVKISLS